MAAEIYQEPMKEASISVSRQKCVGSENGAWTPPTVGLIIESKQRGETPRWPQSGGGSSRTGRTQRGTSEKGFSLTTLR